MASHGGRRTMSLPSSSSSSLGRKKPYDTGTPDSARKSLLSSRSTSIFTGERTVKRLRLSRALTIPDSTSIYDACRQMAARRIDALLLTDANALLCGILTDNDIATRVIAREIDLEDTPVSRVMTRNPIFVLSDTPAVEALQKMVQGKFRHLPVVESGEVIALLDIAKCLYDAIARMERAAEKGKVIAAAVEGVEKHCGTGPNTYAESLRDLMFKPSLSTIIPEIPKVGKVSLNDSVLKACKKMQEFRISYAVVTFENKPLGIITSKDILMRVIAQNLSPESAFVEKVMTPNPECATVDTPIVDALHSMHDGKFLHLPVVDRVGNIVAVVDVIQITHAAVASVGNATGTNNEVSSTMMQKFWDSAMALRSVDDDEETQSDASLKWTSEGGETRSTALGPAQELPNTFCFKIQDKRGRMHRFTCDTQTLAELVSSILQRLGGDIDRNNLPHILYEDEDGDRCVLTSDNDLIAAMEHARSAGWKGLRLHLEYAKGRGGGLRSGGCMDYANADAWSAVAAGAAVIAGLGLLTYFRRSTN